MNNTQTSSIVDNWKGSILTGSEGASRIQFFTALIDNEDLKAFNEHFNSNCIVFEPWMSHKINYDTLSSIRSRDSFIIQKASDLKMRSEAFTNGKIKNIKNIFANASNEQIVMEPNDIKLAQFVRLNDFSLTYLNELGPSWNKRLRTLAREIIPQDSSDISRPLRKNGSGLSTHYYRKGILLGCPAKSDIEQFEYLLNLVHELGHQAFITYQRHDKIVFRDHASGIYSVIRKTERPLIQSIHAMVAVMYMLELIISDCDRIKTLANYDYVQDRFRGLINDLKEAIEVFKDIPFTKLGEQIYREAVAIAIKSEMEYAKF